MSSTVSAIESAPAAFGADVQQRLRTYYERYYRDDLGLPDWPRHVEQRIREETMESLRFHRAMQGRVSLSGKKFLNVGCGTGGVNIVALQAGMDPYGIEPSEDALAICRLKAQALRIPDDHFQKGWAEHLPYADNFFDVVYCFTVLEHVQDVTASLRELVRVLRPGGMLYIHIPNYWAFYEGHYKVFWLPMFPKPLARLYLRWRNRPTAFLSTINYVTPGLLKRILRPLPVQVEHAPLSLSWKGSLRSWLILWAYQILHIQTGDLWIIKNDPSQS